MSRCFSFPPPGYERKSRVSDEAIIESIKREQDKAEKKRRKEEKREKKERKKKEKSGVTGEVEKKRHSHKDGTANADCKFIDYQNKKEYETEQLEKSGLSEEHGRPSSVPNLCDSSDSTQNSHKRKRHSSPLEGSHNQSTMLRIRLPLVKHKDPEELQSKQQQCSSSGGTETPAHNMADIGGPSTSIKQSCSVSGRTELPTQQRSEPAAAAAAPLKSSPFKSGSLSDAQLRYLIENWVPPQIQTELTDFDDQEWLFDVPSNREPKRCKVSNDASYFESSSLWPPRARYLPEAEIYALPYTVPF